MWKKEQEMCVIHLEVTPLFIQTTKGISTTHTSSFDLVFSFSLHKSSNLIDPDFTFFFLFFAFLHSLTLTLFYSKFVFFFSLQILCFWIPLCKYVRRIFNNCQQIIANNTHSKWWRADSNKKRSRFNPIDMHSPWRLMKSIHRFIYLLLFLFFFSKPQNLTAKFTDAAVAYKKWRIYYRRLTSAVRCNRIPVPFWLHFYFAYSNHHHRIQTLYSCRYQSGRDTLRTNWKFLKFNLNFTAAPFICHHKL